MASTLKNGQLLTFLSYLSGAPIVAAPIFIMLGILEFASAITMTISLIFASMIP
jgi:hypothetical protein